MAWPPPTLPTTRTDTTVMASTHPADHNAANLAINDTVAFVKPTAWTNATYQNGFGTIAASQPLQYRKIGDCVQVRGLMTMGTNGQACTTLPAGYRPPLPISTVGSSFEGGPALAYVDLTVNGGIIISVKTASSGVGLLLWFSTVA